MRQDTFRGRSRTEPEGASRPPTTAKPRRNAAPSDDDRPRRLAMMQLALKVAGLRAWEAEIVDGVPTRFLRVGADGATHSLTGYCIHPDDLPPVKRAYERALTGTSPFHIDCRIADGHGGYRRAQCWCTIVRNTDGSPGRLVVLERKSPPMNTRGQPSERPEATRDPRGRDDAEFIAMMSHELRSPITVIGGNARVLRNSFERLTRDQQTRALDDISDAADRLHLLIDDLMILAGASDSGALADQMERVVVRNVVSRVVKRHRRAQPARYFDTIIAGRNALVSVHGVPAYIEQILSNLIANAVKYSPPASPIEVMVEPDDRMVSIHVLDRGMGIDAEEADRIFVPFYRAARAAKLVDGNGIGLAVCRRLAEVQAGSVTARPRPGGGSDFTLWLPRSRPTSPRSTGSRSRALPPVEFDGHV